MQKKYTVLPPDFLHHPPLANDGSFFQSWFKSIIVGSISSVEEIGLPENLVLIDENDQKVTAPVRWAVSEFPWGYDKKYYDPNQPGVFTFTGELEGFEIKPQIFIKNQPKPTVRPRVMEKLNRGVVAVPLPSQKGILVRWRILATEYNKNLTFNVYRNEDKINFEPISIGNFVDQDGQAGDQYQVEVIETCELSLPIVAWKNNYLDIPLQRPSSRSHPAKAFGAPDETPDISYTANDMSVADVNGDGQYELLVKWDPSQQQDPGLMPRHTGETIFDLYTLEGQLLWRINMGINITSSAHHCSFNFIDLNEDGIAEFAIKTADGTRVYHPKVDGTICDLKDEPIAIIGDPEAVWVGQLTNPVTGTFNDTTIGRISLGAEYLTVFNGLTGLPIDTVDYFAPYNITDNWGDTENNRSDRFMAATAYLPKKNKPEHPYPSIIEVRGHYGPHFVAAYQLIDHQLELIWSFRLKDWVKKGCFGNHSISIADVDKDGFDEIIFGSMVLKYDGIPLWIADGSRGTLEGCHGDALHLSVMTPNCDEFYVMTPLERTAPNVKVYNANTGETIWEYGLPLPDVGRGIAANITPEPGFEIWAGDPPVPGAKPGTPIYNLVSGKIVKGVQPGINFRIYWDGDLLSELLNGNLDEPLNITKFNDETGEIELLQDFIGTRSNNGTKANPGIQADIFGDWREEVIVRGESENFIRIYTTNIPTDLVMYTLMHDPAYRLQVNAQNATYNQPPHVGFYIGEDIRQQVKDQQLPIPNIIFSENS
jgi:hypothetical protein